MKKIISILTILTLITILIFSGTSKAAALTTIDVTTDKTIVRPGQEVSVKVEFGQQLGAYTFDVFYDDNIFDYVKVEGGEANDTSDKVKVTYYDTRNPRTNMSITFRAKSEITTSNPTEITLTAEGLSNADASVRYDDITTPIVKNLTVEPEYVPYTLNLTPTGETLKEEKQVTISYSSSMGRYYQHARLVASATTPDGANVRLLATDGARLEHDIIESGWGESQGYAIGGRDVSQVLQAKAIFSDYGDYTITLKLIDRDNSDTVISEKTFNYSVVETLTPPATEENEEQATTPQETEQNKSEEEKTPTKLPKTGSNIYSLAVLILVSLAVAYLYISKKK